MENKQIEVINIDDLQVVIRREPSAETYLALEPPDALPYVVASKTASVEEIAAFVHQRLDALHSLRREMLKHYQKSKSLKCRFKTGDVAYLLGRPFMLRSNPLGTSVKASKASRSLTNIQAAMYSDFSVINLFVAQAGSYDQGRAAFMSYAQKVFSINIKSLLAQCMERVFPGIAVPTRINSRPMRNAWVVIDEERDVVWFSENLIPYPPHAVVYAYLNEAIARYAPEADEKQFWALMEKGVPNWREMKALLADPNNRYAL